MNQKYDSIISLLWTDNGRKVLHREVVMDLEFVDNFGFYIVDSVKPQSMKTAMFPLREPIIQTNCICN